MGRSASAMRFVANATRMAELIQETEAADAVQTVRDFNAFLSQAPPPHNRPAREQDLLDACLAIRRAHWNQCCDQWGKRLVPGAVGSEQTVDEAFAALLVTVLLASRDPVATRHRMMEEQYRYPYFDRNVFPVVDRFLASNVVGRRLRDTIESTTSMELPTSTRPRL